MNKILGVLLVAGICSAAQVCRPVACQKKIDKTTCGVLNMTNITYYGTIDPYYTCPFDKNAYCNNLWEVYNPLLTSLCLPKLGNGAHCYSGYQCVSHLCHQGNCITSNTVDGVCLSSLQCKYNFYCENSTCAKRIDYGKACSSSGQCYLDAECVGLVCVKLFSIEDNQTLPGNTTYYPQSYLCRNLYISSYNRSLCGNIMELNSLVPDKGHRSKKCNVDSDCVYISPLTKNQTTINGSCQCPVSSTNGQRYCKYGGSEQEMLFSIADVSV